MPVPIRSIQNTLNTFSSSSAYSSSSTSSSSRANVLANLGGLMGKHHTTGLSLSAWRSSSSSSSAQNQPTSSPSPGVIRRPQRPSIRISSSRRVPPPSPEQQDHSAPYFAPPHTDELFNPTRTVIYDSHPSPIPSISRSRTGSVSKSPSAKHHHHHQHQGATTTATTSFSMQTLLVPAQIASAPDSDARSKMVAGILLHRVHAVGKPMRRKSPHVHSGPREYVRSNLSIAVTVEC